MVSKLLLFFWSIVPNSCTQHLLSFYSSFNALELASEENTFFTVRKWFYLRSRLRVKKQHWFIREKIAKLLLVSSLDVTRSERRTIIVTTNTASCYLRCNNYISRKAEYNCQRRIVCWRGKYTENTDWTCLCCNGSMKSCLLAANGPN